jgi:hypothetical protein
VLLSLLMVVMMRMRMARQGRVVRACARAAHPPQKLVASSGFLAGAAASRARASLPPKPSLTLSPEHAHTPPHTTARTTELPFTNQEQQQPAATTTKPTNKQSFSVQTLFLFLSPPLLNAMASRAPPGQAKAYDADKEIADDMVVRVKQAPLDRLMVKGEEQLKVLASLLSNGLPVTKLVGCGKVVELSSLHLDQATHTISQGEKLQTRLNVKAPGDNGGKLWFSLYHPGGKGMSAQRVRQALHAMFASS